MKSIHAVYEEGVFKPTEPVDLPEHCPVRVEPESEALLEKARQEALDKVYEVLDRRFDSGETDVAERHNEHQP
jgi:predicted DNA-binding antitoxin AbrB/MazE fold protein